MRELRQSSGCPEYRAPRDRVLISREVVVVSGLPTPSSSTPSIPRGLQGDSIIPVLSSSDLCLFIRLIINLSFPLESNSTTESSYVFCCVYKLNHVCHSCRGTSLRCTAGKCTTKYFHRRVIKKSCYMSCG